MTILRVLCRDCSSYLELDPRDAEVLECTNVPSLTTLGYRCPVCGPQLRALDAREQSIVVSAGVAVRRWVSEPDLPPLTAGDLLDFHLNLDAEVSALLGGAA
jgi:hypothetical protein